MENNRNVKINKYINYNKYFEGYRFIEGYNNYLINEKGNIIEIKPVKIDEHLRVYLNNKYVSLINIFAKTFIKNPHNCKNASLINKDKDISIENIKWGKDTKPVLTINIYEIKDFKNKKDINSCNKILFKSYNNVNECCKNLLISTTTYYTYSNKKILKNKKLNKYIYIETLYKLREE